MLNNDEIFFLCVLTGAKEILGIEKPIERGTSKDKMGRSAEKSLQKSNFV